MQKLLPNKVIIVTGAAGGIGAASAEYFSAQGAIVALTDLQADPLQQTVRKINSQGGETISAVVDLCIEEQVANFFNQVHAKYGKIDGLMACAGVGYQQTVLETEAESFSRVMEANVLSVFLCCKHAYRLMQSAQSGSLVLIASRLAHAAYPNMTPYIASKGAVLSMSRSLAVDFGEAGIRVNAVLPGATETPMQIKEIAQSANPVEARRFFENQTIIGGLAQPQDIAQAAGFLLSDNSRFITGTGVTVDGGCLARIFEGAAQKEI